MTKTSKFSLKSLSESIKRAKKKHFSLEDLDFRYRPLSPFKDLVKDSTGMLSLPVFVGTFLDVAVYEDKSAAPGMVELRHKGVVIETFTI